MQARVTRTSTELGLKVVAEQKRNGADRSLSNQGSLDTRLACGLLQGSAASGASPRTRLATPARNRNAPISTSQLKQRQLLNPLYGFFARYGGARRNARYVATDSTVPFGQRPHESFGRFQASRSLVPLRQGGDADPYFFKQLLLPAEYSCSPAIFASGGARQETGAAVTRYLRVLQFWQADGHTISVGGWHAAQSEPAPAAEDLQRGAPTPINHPQF